MIKNKLKTIYGVLILLSLNFSVQTFAQQTKSIVSTEESVTESVKLVPCKKEDRIEAVKKLFAQMGAKENEITVEKFDKDKISNVVVRKKGKTDETIVIGAHYDKVDSGCGAIDNWSGVVIVAHLFKTFSQIETQKSYVFVAFDQEEKGLFGSKEMAKAIPKENRQQYCAMINFDSFGIAAPFSFQNVSSPKLTLLAQKLAEENEFKLVSAKINNALADSLSFNANDIPAITLSGIDGNWENYLHTQKDQLGKINMSSIYFGYRFGLLFTNKIDASACQEFREQAKKVDK